MTSQRLPRCGQVVAAAGFLLAIWPVKTLAEPNPDAALARQVRELAGPLAEEKLFSGVVLIERSDGGRVLETFGLADVESNRPVTADTRFCIASITKPMTQLVFAQLMADGKLSGGDLASKYLPGFPKGPTGVEATVDMLLQHRAGVPHRVTKPSEEAERWTPERIVARLAEVGLQFDPGTKRSYSSAGYTCLARIAEIVESKPYRQIIRDRVFVPAEMKAAMDPEPRELIPLAARDYLRTLDGGGKPALERAQPRDFAFLAGAGSVWATAEDLVRFAQALRAGKFDQDAFEKLTARQSGDWVQLDGATGGFVSRLDINRRSQTLVVCLSNTRTGAVSELADRLRELVDTGKVRPVEPPPRISADDALLRDVCGSYTMAGEDFMIQPWWAGVLVDDSFAYPIEGGKLFSAYWYAELRPVRDAKGRTSALEAWIGDRTYRSERK